MSEFGHGGRVEGRPTDIDLAAWAEELEHECTEPNESRRDDGWATNDQYPHDIANWQFRTLGRAVQFVDSVVMRQFSSLSEGIATIDELGRPFLVRPNGEEGQGETVVNRSVAVGPCCTDGLRIYALGMGSSSETKKVYAFDPVTLNQLWVVTPDAGYDLGGICCDGERVFVTLLFDSIPEGHTALRALNPATGANLGGFSTTHGGTKVVSNGTEVAFIHYDGEDVVILDADTLTNPRYWEHEAGIDDIAMDADQLYVIGEESGGGPGRFIFVALDDATAIDGLDLDPSATRLRVLADGDFVYVADIGGTNTIKCYARHFVAGGLAEIWSQPFPVYSGNVGSMALDDELIYFVESAAQNVIAIDKRTGAPRWMASGYEARYICADGMGLFVVDTGLEALARFSSGYGTKAFVRVGEGYGNRKPVFGLAMPMR